MAAALYSLDEARPMSRAGRLAAWVGGVVYLGASLGVFSRGSDPWPALVWVPIAHALVLFVVCGLTSLLLYGQASATRRRGYLWLGGTYLYVAVLLLSFPLFFPGGFGGQEPLLGRAAVGPLDVLHLALRIRRGPDRGRRACSTSTGSGIDVPT